MRLGYSAGANDKGVVRQNQGIGTKTVPQILKFLMRFAADGRRLVSERRGRDLSRFRAEAAADLVAS
jgi:hypothetical protein